MTTTVGLDIKAKRPRAGLYQWEIVARTKVSQTKMGEAECGGARSSLELPEEVLGAIKRARDAKARR